MSIARHHSLSLPPLTATASSGDAEERRRLRPRPRPTVRSERDRIAAAARRLARLAHRFDRALADCDDDDHADTHDQFLRHLVKPSEGELVDWRDLDARVLDRFAGDEEVSSRRYFRRLTRLVVLARSFERLVGVARGTLRDSLRDADAYLASHGDEAAGAADAAGGAAATAKLRSLAKYECRAAECRMALVDGLASIERLAAAVETRRPLVAYLADYAKVLHYMREASEQAGACAVELRRWLAADEAYVGEVGVELRRLLARRRELAEAESRAPAPEVAAIVRTLASNRNAGDVLAIGEAIRTSELRVAALRTGLAKIDEDLAAAAASRHVIGEAAAGPRRRLRLRRRGLQRGELAAARDVICQAAAAASDCLTSGRQYPSTGRDYDRSTMPLDSAALQAVAARALQEEDGAAARRRRAEELSGRRRSLLQSADRAQHRLRVARCELEARTREAAELRRKEERERREVAAGARAARELDAQLAALQRILDLKTSSKVLRVQADGDVALSREFDAILHDAVVKCAQAVGRMWPILYASLTFVPERAEDQIASDIHGIRRVGERLGHDEASMAEAALSRWAKFSRAATAAELSFVCRKVLQPGQCCQNCGDELVACARCRLPRLGRFSSTECN